MIRVLLDTNIVLDALLDRAPWNADARAIWEAQLGGRLAAHVTASSLTDVFYVARRHAGRDRAWLAIRACLDQLHVIALGINELREALQMPGNDFEDNVQTACAMAAEVDAIVTRDLAGFLSSQIEVVSPREILLRLAAED
ncbi:MAG: PIN domain-containing protein [Planctomycetota bacterium]|nr:PIN domain-containing protein [Planctomycetota bacterium]